MNEEQKDLIARYFAAVDTGLVGISYDHPESKEEIYSVFSGINYDYYNELGEDLTEELKMWKKNVNKGLSKELMEEVNERISFIFK